MEHIEIEIDPCFASQINNTPHDIIEDLPSLENDLIKCQHFSLSEKNWELAFIWIYDNPVERGHICR